MQPNPTTVVPARPQGVARPEAHGFDRRTTARMVGILYIVGTVAGALSAVVLVPILDAPDVLVAVTEHANPALLGAALVLVMGFALAVIPLLMYPLLKTVNEPMALGYVMFRGGLETVAYLGSAFVTVVLVSLGRSGDAAGAAVTPGLDAVAAAALAAGDAVGEVGLTFVFALGATMFSVLLLRGRLVPRWLAGWGLVAALLWLGAGALVLFGHLEPRTPAQIALAVPIAVQEMVLAGWLIVRGFDESVPRAPAGQPAATPM